MRASAAGKPLLVLVAAVAILLPALRLGGWAAPNALLVAPGLLLLGLVGLGVARFQTGLFARPVIAADPRRAGGRIALTFDDGPDPQSTRAVLDRLEGRGHRGTFFIIGERAERHPELVAELALRGHGIGNHSFDHANATPFRTVGRLAGELLRVNDLVERVAQIRPRWFRPPVGLLSPRVVAAAERARLELVGWSVRARDGVAHPSVDAAVQRLSRGLRPGAIVLLHDAPAQRAATVLAILDRLFDELDARGLRSVTLDDLLG